MCVSYINMQIWYKQISIKLFCISPRASPTVICIANLFSWRIIVSSCSCCWSTRGIISVYYTLLDHEGCISFFLPALLLHFLCTLHHVWFYSLKGKETLIFILINSSMSYFILVCTLISSIFRLMFWFIMIKFIIDFNFILWCIYVYLCL